MSESREVRALLDGMESLSSADAGYIEKLNEAFDQLVSDLKALHNPKGLTKTDARGYFSIEGLDAGQKYFVLAIDWDKGDSDDFAYYRHLITQELPPGTTVLSIYMGPGHESDCGKH